MTSSDIQKKQLTYILFNWYIVVVFLDGNQKIKKSFRLTQETNQFKGCSFEKKDWFNLCASVFPRNFRSIKCLRGVDKLQRIYGGHMWPRRLRWRFWSRLYFIRMSSRRFNMYGEAIASNFIIRKDCGRINWSKSYLFWPQNLLGHKDKFKSN